MRSKKEKSGNIWVIFMCLVGDWRSCGTSCVFHSCFMWKWCPSCQTTPLFYHISLILFPLQMYFFVLSGHMLFFTEKTVGSLTTHLMLACIETCPQAFSIFVLVQLMILVVFVVFFLSSDVASHLLDLWWLTALSATPESTWNRFGFGNIRKSIESSGTNAECTVIPAFNITFS